MHLNSEDFANSYSQMSDAELLELARSYDSLVVHAQAALRAEFRRRSLETTSVDEDEPPSAMCAPVEVRRYRDLSEAIVARSLLESAGIPVYLRDENLVRLDWQISNFIGGIRLQVDAENEAAATELLDQPVPASIDFGGADDFAQPRCPKCDSLDITYQGSSRGAVLTSLYILSLPLPLGPERWICSACGALWEDVRSPDDAAETSGL